jgi:2-polyprenyl-3-methyl-5-hydroxy-6-metoxy-1,4-benzoquinol methylase
MAGLDARIDAPELMDAGQTSPAATRRALAFLALANRWFGGSRIIVRHLERWARSWPAASQPITVLDVGTGSADVPIAVARWARSRGHPLKVTGVDSAESIVGVARERARPYPEITIMRADLFALAATPARYDYVIATLFLHHVEQPRLVAALTALDRLAGRGLIVSDLQRTRASWLAVGTAGYLLGNAIVRHDAPLSVRRAFRTAELTALAQQAGLDYLAARPEPWFRVCLAGEQPDAR